VCESLADPPLDRLATEKDILRAEEAGRGGSAERLMALWRYGARDFGLAGFPEFGLHRFTPDDVTNWISRWFTLENAVLWIAGDAVPEGLDLRLTSGVRQPMPTASSALPVTPAYFHGPDRLVAMQAPVRRTAAARPYTSLLQRALFRRLRQDDGVSYAVDTAFTPISAGTASVLAVADAADGRAGQVVDGFLDVLDDLARNPVADDELEIVLRQTVTAMTGPNAEAARLPGISFGMLAGQAWRQTEELTAEVEAVTSEAVRQVAAEVRASMLVAAPAGNMLDRRGLEQAPQRSRFAVDGRGYRSATDHRTQLVIGAEGVSTVDPRGPATVLYAECVAYLAFPDGERQLIGPDAISVSVRPLTFGLREPDLARLDEAVPAQVRIPMPARDPGALTGPSRTGRTRSRFRQARDLWIRSRMRARTFRAGRREIRVRWSLVIPVVLLVALVALVVSGHTGPTFLLPGIILVSRVGYALRGQRRRR